MERGQENPGEEDKAQEILNEAINLPDLGVSVSGLAGRFPKSDNVNEFERNLRQGLDMINDEDNSRFTCRLWNLPPRAGRIKDLSRFDATFFGYAKEEANYVDYQMRLLYEVVYESILDAGLNPAELRGSNTSVFFGFHCNEFENAMVDNPGFKSNGYYGQFATRISQYFDLRGLTVTFDAACASGFVALHHGVDSIRSGLCDRAIVCSSNIPIHPTGSFIFLQMQMLSPTGYSRFMDSRADGYVKSESCVSVLLQRKDLSLRNYANFMATMTSVDGYKREGITFPSDKSQESLMRATKRLANISTNHVEYFEAHGTGTPAGDPQECKAIASVYACAPEDGDDENEQRQIGPLLLGSVKTNMGHSEAASGLCALTKVAMMLEHELIYPSLHFAEPNANIESLKDGRVEFVGEQRPLRAKVVPLSCYGFGGSNVHAIVRSNELGAIANQPISSSPSAAIPRLVLMFGRGEQQLSSFFDKMLDRHDYQTKNCLTDDFLVLLDSLNAGKIDRLMTHRGFILIDPNSKQELSRSIKRCELKRNENSQSKHFQEAQKTSINLVFPGFGCNFDKMGAGLVNFDPFWSTIERLEKTLESKFGRDEPTLRELLCETEGSASLSLCSKFCSIVSYELALVNLFVKNNGTWVDKIYGPSVGEVAAAYARGLLNEADAIAVAYQLGKILDENRHLISGQMVALEMSEHEANQTINTYKKQLQSSEADTIAVSCIDGPHHVTISGSTPQMNPFRKWLEVRRLHLTLVEENVALHNPLLMGDIIREKLRFGISGVLESPKGYATADYFAKMMCNGANFDASAHSNACLELGPSGFCEQRDHIDHQHHHRNSTTSSNGKVSQLAPSRVRQVYLRCMERDTEPRMQITALLQCLGKLYQVGVNNISLRDIYPSMKSISCVRRQTPSLSSLFEWQHDEQFFVPRYPLQFSKSSAKCEMPVDIMQERDKYLLGHCVEGRCLFPATGYLFLIWRVFSFTKRKIYDACFHDVEQELVPIEFHQVRLLRAVIVNNRVAQLYIHLEESTGRFEIKEGGSVVVEGWARSPEENPTGLLYDSVRERITREELPVEMVRDDIYKQFRVSGYDYGDTFQNIVEASGDGRYCKVKFNGHFVALTDSVLQSIFLAVSQYAPSGGLFLPTRFDYVRFQPEIILAKLRQLGLKLDRSDGSLNTMAKREIMTKIMERENGIVDQNQKEPPEGDEIDKAEPDSAEAEPEKPCFFDTYCDPITGIIITDGIEMRGIKASPAPRKMDTKDVLLESYQFVPDCEEPIKDNLLTGFDSGFLAEYAQICDYLASKLANQRNGSDAIQFEERAIAFKEKHLKCMFSKLNKPQNLADKAGREDSEAAADSNEDEPEQYDIKKNGNLVLLSILEQLEHYSQVGRLDQGKVGEILHKNRRHLMRDVIQDSFTCERLMRPIVESVLENSCQRKSKVSILEINEDDGLMRAPMNQLVKTIQPTFTLEYLLAHPDPARVNNIAPANEVKTHVLKDIRSLLSDQRLRDLDLILYKDISCYENIPADKPIDRELQCPKTIISSLAEGVKRGGFLLVLMRSKLTTSENLLLSMSSIGQQSERDMHQMNEAMNERVKLLRSTAREQNLIEVSSKSDLNGCYALLFRRPESSETSKQNLLLRVTHQDEQEIEDWLSKLKQIFSTPTEQKAEESAEKTPEDLAGTEMIINEEKNEVAESENNKVVWLCAVDTSQESASGLVGMMQALLKELGATRLRCFYDQFTFAKFDHNDITIELIENSNYFKQVVKRDLIWNCVNRDGQLGSYRHFTIDQYLSYANCLCDSQEIQSTQTNEQEEGQEQHQVACYVNNATRGDLSSFTWFEAPFKYLGAGDNGAGDSLVRVCYSSLNFRDIMLATGRLPLDSIPIKLAMSDCHMGLEFAGYDLQTGKRVMGMLPARGIATQIVCPSQNSIKFEIPDEMDMCEAATIPVVYATVVLALIYRGKMQAGESILIHAGSGGVGQAAIRMALWFGLEVFTTVGTQEKRKFLLEEFGIEMRADFNENYLLDDHIFSSRDTIFEKDILRMTSSRGVDLILNSLADDKLQASLRCLADGGRFLEIGKYDLSVDTRLELINLNHNKTFHGILLDKLFDSDDTNSVFRNQLNCVLDTMREGFDKGFVKPIKYTIFKRNQIEKAFRYMASGKHIGKILIEIEAPREHKSDMARIPLPRLSCVPRFQMNPESSHIITGGLGGFGLELIKWLVQRGGRSFLITSRGGLRTGYQKITLKRLQNQGAKFQIITYDTTTREGVRRLLDEAQTAAVNHKIGSIFHLAMVLNDSLLENMTSEKFHQVCQPKVTTCQLMDEILSENRIDVDHFVTFSSVTSGKGNAGQANYAYANSLTERICERRRARGQHGLAIQWGAIGDVGAAYENLGGNNVVVGGTIPQRMPSCYATLGKMLCSPFAICSSVVPVNRGSDASAMGAKGDLVGAILHVLGIKDSSKVSEEATLGELGLDSLMAVEIRQYIEREYDMTLNMQEIRALTIGKIREIGEKGPAIAKKEVILNEEVEKQSSDSRKEPIKGKPKAAKVPLESTPPPASEKARTDRVDSGKLISDLSQNGMKIDEIQSDFLKNLHVDENIHLDINYIGGFKPELHLPRRKFKKLNTAQLSCDQTHFKGPNDHQNHLYNYLEQQQQYQQQQQHQQQQPIPDRPSSISPDELRSSADSPAGAARPLFFLPPIYGSFELLESICKLVDRPCIGLNWTRSHARATSMSEAVEMYISNLKQWKWSIDEDAGGQQVDLVGYSYGATVAFEMMVNLHSQSKQNKTLLRPGRLILLDGSPKQIEISSQLMSTLNNKAKLSETDKVDELLMAYVLSHTKHLAISKRNDLLELQAKLRATKLNKDKARLASETLCHLLELTQVTANATTTPDQTDSGAASDNSLVSDYDGLSEELESSSASDRIPSESDDFRAEMELAMEAYVRRYDIVDKYKCTSKLDDNIVLIRAEEVYLRKSSGKSFLDDDLGLSSIANKVELHVMSGNHQTFLDKNRNKIAKIINSQTSQ